MRLAGSAVINQHTIGRPVCLCIVVLEPNVLNCRRQGHPGLPGPGIFVHSCMPHGVVILTAKPIISRGAEGEPWNLGQDDPDAPGVLDLNPGRGWTPAWGIRYSGTR